MKFVAIVAGALLAACGHASINAALDAGIIKDVPVVDAMKVPSVTKNVGTVINNADSEQKNI